MNGINIMNINVTKRDGTKQEFDLEKVHRVLEWATNGITTYIRTHTKLSIRSR
jgi:transcriptional regulator NrdR family protein